MKLLRLDASVRTRGSVSRAMGDMVERRLAEAGTDLHITRRDIGRAPLPPLWVDALEARATPNVAGYLAEEVPAEPSASQPAGMSVAATLVDELVDSDAYLLTTAMYNFSVPQQIKQWVDLIICDSRAADTNVPILSERPALVIIAKGGAYRPGTPKAGSDHATPWLRTVLESTWGLDLTIVELELTMAEHNPSMSDLVPLAQQIRAAGETEAIDWADRTAGSVTISKEWPLR